MKLNEQHLRAIQLFAMGMNCKNVARELNVQPESVSRWRADFDFRAKLNEVLADSEEAVKTKLRSLSEVALRTLEDVMLDLDAPPRDRTQAACKILELTAIKTANIGSTKSAVLKNQKEMNDSLDEFLF